MADRKGRLLLIDGHSLAFRAFFALPPESFSTKDGQHTNAVYGFTSMLADVVPRERPTHLAVAFDLAGGTFRTREYTEYKGTRSETPPEFRGQIELIQELLDALNITHVVREDFEADDIIATLTARGLDADLEVLILSGDRDSLQLVTEHSTVLYPVRGVSEMARMTPAAVEEKYGVPPRRYPELAALVGETSDNLPGVPKVGPKTAAKWINEFDGLDNILARADEIKGVAGENLRAHIDDVVRNRRLNRLVDDLDLPVRVTDLERQAWARTPVFGLLDAWNFGAGIKGRLVAGVSVEGKTVEGDDADDDAAPLVEAREVHDEVLAAGAAPAYLAALGAGTFGVEMCGHWSDGSGEVTAIALATSEGSGAFIDFADPINAKAAKAWLANGSVKKIAHDAKGPIEALAAGGFKLGGLVSDTALAAYIDEPGHRSYSLEAVALRVLQREIPEPAAEAQGELDLDLGGEEPKPDGSNALLRAHTVLDLAEILSERLESSDQSDLMATIELPLVGVLARMEETGIAVDLGYLRDLEKQFGEEASQAVSLAHEMAGHEVNLGSPKQLQVVLFDELNLPKTKKTKTGYTTDADSLQWLLTVVEPESKGEKFLTALLRHRDRAKLRVIVSGLAESVRADGRIHTTFQQTVAATGRLASTDPNLQNVPVRTEDGRRIRQAFVAQAPFDELLTADYSQIEMRIMAHLSQDTLLIEAFNSGVDFHTVTASRVFGVAADKVTPDQRAKIKAMNYGLAYGLSSYGLSQQLGIEVGEAKALMDDYFTTFGGVKAYLDGVVDEARKRKDPYTATMWGRRRYLPDLHSDSRQHLEAAQRVALNAPIQGSAADLIKIAMLKVQSTIAKAKLQSRMLLQVHDELVFEVAPGEREALETLVREQMGTAAELAVPLDVSVGTGANWQAAAH